MNLGGINYKNLCQLLADSERALRKNQRVNTAVIVGRADQLKYMEEYYPEHYPSYLQALQTRISKPYNFQAIFDSIPTNPA